MSNYVKCHVPAKVEHWESTSASTLSTKFKELLQLALGSSLKPQALPDDVQKIAVDLTKELEPLSKRLAELIDQRLVSEGTAPGRLAGMLVQAQLNATTASTAPPTPSTQPATGAQLWPDQVQLHEEFMASAKRGSIVAVEAGTGTGKSRVIAACALSLLELRKTSPKLTSHTDGANHYPDFIKERVAAWHATAAEKASRPWGTRPIVIAAPTIATMMHLLREFLQLQGEAIQASHSLLIGKQQFASPSAIAELLMDHSCPPVQQWLDAGMPAGQSRATRGVPTSGLMEDLRTLAAGLDFPIKDACLSAQSDDDDCAEYTRLQAAAEHADIIFTTHAMLAMRTIALSRGNKPPIPQPYALLIDEAHALEDGFAAVNGASLAMSRLGPSLKGEAWSGTGLVGKAEACKEAWTQAFLALQSMPEEITLPHPAGNDKTTRAWNFAKAKLHALRDQLQALSSEAAKRQKASQNAHLALIDSSKKAIDLVLDEYTGRVEFSPSRRFPSIQVGVKSVTASLLYTWESAPVAGLFSGTLFASGESADGAANALAMELAIPKARLHVTSRLHPSWLFTSPLLLLPKPGSVPRPPKGETLNEDGVTDWAQSIAAHVNTITQTAAGGTLVLCTGYERAHIIAKALAKTIDHPERIIEQRPSMGVDGMAHAFREKSRLGIKPIAIATGGAWTGLDLSDNDFAPKDDYLLTDLVITAIPFNTQRSFLHAQKVLRVGMQVEINYALRKFTQGIGRLIRRPGLQQRRLWILDGRLESVRAATYSSRFLSALSRYINRAYF
uniref:Putative helicase n=1 Tax=viral metagenome TaxID=1070528 RepID=A0A6H1ZKR6_9ZZZZ